MVSILSWILPLIYGAVAFEGGGWDDECLTLSTCLVQATVKVERRNSSASFGFLGIDVSQCPSSLCSPMHSKHGALASRPARLQRQSLSLAEMISRLGRFVDIPVANRLDMVHIMLMAGLSFLFSLPLSTIDKYKVLAFRCCLGIAFGTVVANATNLQVASEWFTCYALEYSLSMDNVFVFILIFQSFKTDEIQQKRVLQIGILGAYVLRFIVLYCGSEILCKCEIAILLFAAFLLWGSFKALTEGDGDNDGDEEEAETDSNAYWLVSKFVPVAKQNDLDRFFTVIDGNYAATPLFICLIVVMLSDIVFAADSVTAVLGTTNDLFVLYTSNVFAVGVLYCLFFVLKSAMVSFKYLQPAVGVILGWIGVKIILTFFRVIDLSPVVSLCIVLAALAIGLGLSLVFPEPVTDKIEDVEAASASTAGGPHESPSKTSRTTSAAKYAEPEVKDHENLTTTATAAALVFSTTYAVGEAAVTAAATIM